MLFYVAYVLTVVAVLALAALFIWFVTRLFAAMDDVRYLRQVREQHEEYGEGELPELVVNQRTPVFPFIMAAVIVLCVAGLLWSFVAWDAITQAFAG